MAAKPIKKLEDDSLSVDLTDLPRSRRYFPSAYSIVIPERTKGWIKSFCEARSCLVRDFAIEIETSDRPVKLTPSRLRCPLCAYQTRRFEFHGFTREDSRKVVRTNRSTL